MRRIQRLFDRVEVKSSRKSVSIADASTLAGEIPESPAVPPAGGTLVAGPVRVMGLPGC